MKKGIQNHSYVSIGHIYTVHTGKKYQNDNYKPKNWSILPGTIFKVLNCLSPVRRPVVSVQAQEEIQNKNCEIIIEKFKICDVFELVTKLYLKGKILVIFMQISHR
jgi:hypothetical protein